MYQLIHCPNSTADSPQIKLSTLSISQRVGKSNQGLWKTMVTMWGDKYDNLLDCGNHFTICIYISDYHIVYLKYKQFLFVNFFNKVRKERGVEECWKRGK